MGQFRSAIVRALFLAGLATITSSASGSDAPDALARNLAATCLGCHPERTAADPLIPVLNGLPRDRLIGTLLAFRDAAPPRPLMAEIASAYSTAEIERIAEYFSTLPRAQDR